MGPYCHYCDQRCFVERVLPDDAKTWAGKTITMATCPRGMRNDRERCGYDHTTAINPLDGSVARRRDTIPPEPTDNGSVALDSGGYVWWRDDCDGDKAKSPWMLLTTEARIRRAWADLWLEFGPMTLLVPLPDREALSALLLAFLRPPRYKGESWTYSPDEAADAVLALLRGRSQEESTADARAAWQAAAPYQDGDVVVITQVDGTVERVVIGAPSQDG